MWSTVNLSTLVVFCLFMKCVLSLCSDLLRAWIGSHSRDVARWPRQEVNSKPFCEDPDSAGANIQQAAISSKCVHRNMV